MEVETGFIYHIKDDFFDGNNDKGLTFNHENGHARSTYFTIKDKDILWSCLLKERNIREFSFNACYEKCS